MTLVLDIQLPFGRYCATPWGRQVNEGAIEWPPSPWRIVRALVASWHEHHPSREQAQIVSALEALCSPPTFGLPPHRSSTTRHYLPTSDLPARKRRRPGTSETSLALNPFVAVAPGATVRVMWDATPSADELATLRMLASTVSYLGRAESRAILRFDVTDEKPVGLGFLDSEGICTNEVLDLLIPTTPLDLDAVHSRTGALHRRRRIVPEGTRWVTYPVPEEVQTGQPSLRRPGRDPVQAITFSIGGRGGPTMENAALLAGVLRGAVTSKARDHRQLHGHVDDNGSSSPPRTDDHQHAHYLVLNDLRHGRRATRLVIWAPGGIPDEALRDVASLSELRVKEYLQRRLGRRVPLSLVQVGRADDLDPRLVGGSRRWRSLTPVTTVRHRKKAQTQADFVEDVIRRELEHHRLPSGEEEVRLFDIVEDRRTYRSRTLDRRRQHRGFHVQLEFAEPVEGPIALGSLAHFGLGVFVHDDSQ